MTRVSAARFYFFGDEYFDGLRTALGERVRLSVVEVDGSVAAAALFVETCGIVQYHLSGTAQPFVREGLTKVLIDHVRRWATERGDRALHLGGGLSSRADDPLFHFKAGFSERRHPFHTLRVVVDEQAYDDLVRSRGPGSSDEDGRDGPAGYFPAYRNPTDAGRPPGVAGDAGPAAT
jgi:hypothetical protein